MQAWLPFNPQKFAAIAPDLAFNTAASFTTNTNWQNYSGEVVMSYFTQMAGLAYHNFISAAVGIALAIAFIRGIARRQMKTIGNFWVDMTRATLWVLLPFCMVGALLLVSQGVVQNLHPYDKAALVEAAAGAASRSRWQTGRRRHGKPVMDTVTEQTIAQGPVASQEIIKEWGTNGGGFFNANSAHPFENPTPLSNFIEMFAIFAVSAGTDLHARPHDRIASPRLGGVVGHGGTVPRRCDYRVLGRGAWQSLAAHDSQPAVHRHASRAETWKARKPASESPIPLSLQRLRPTRAAAPSTAGTIRSLRSEAWFRW